MTARKKEAYVKNERKQLEMMKRKKERNGVKL